MRQVDPERGTPDSRTDADLKTGAVKGAARLRWLSRRRVQHLAAFLLYLAAWSAVMVPKILHHLNDRLLSTIPQEASVFVWSLAWWPHALAHPSNPLLSSAVWAPTGINLAWVTTAPGPSILASPLTLLGSPVLAFNVLVLLTPPLTAWTAYLFSRHVSGSFLAGLAGGAIFGFSPVVMREIQQGHLNLSMLFLLPLAAYLVVRRVEGSISRRRFVLLMTAVLVGEFSIFTEIFATMFVVGALLALAAVLLAPNAIRDRAVDTVRLAGLSFVISGVIVLPYLYTAFAYPQATKPPGFRGLGLSLRGLWDLRRFVVPGSGFMVGPRPGGGLSELNFWYLGLPLLLVLVLYWIRNRRTYPARVLAAGFLISIVLSLGRAIPVGHVLVPLPWALFSHLPLFDRARPRRIVAYAFLFASASLALWVTQTSRWPRDAIVRWGLVVLAAAFILPNFLGTWTASASAPPFFATQQYRQQLCPNETVMVVAAPPKQLLWQAQTGIYFRTIGWYPSFRPANYADIRTALRLQKGAVGPGDQTLVRRFLTQHHVTAIVLGGGQTYAATQLQALLGTAARQIGGITLIRLAPCSQGGSA